ncbi:MAG: PAS domain S-box protein [Desulfobacterales bacterium]|jgi:PAS domain S-box-containing protein
MTQKPTYKELEKSLREMKKEIRKLKRVEEALRESEYEKESILNSLVEHVIYQDTEMRIQWANRAACKSANLTNEEIVGSYCYEIWPQSGESCPDCPIKKAMKTGQPEEIEKYTPDGKAWIIRGIPVKGSDGKILGAIEVTLEITERKQAEDKLRQSEEQHLLYFENVSDVIFSIDPDTRIINISPSVEKILGYKPEEIIGKLLRDLDILTPDSLEKAFSNALSVLSGKRNSLSQYEFISKDGTKKFGEVSSTPLFRDGKIIAMTSVARDITERKCVEDALKQSEEKYRTVLEANPDPVIVYDMEGKVNYFNPAFTRVFGWTLDECFGRKMDFFVPEDAWPETKMMIKKVISGESFSGVETLRYTKEGNIIPVSMSGAIYRGGDKNPTGSVINIRNIDEQKKLERQFQQAQKMEAIGTLAGGIAHDFNNLLMGIQGRISLISFDTDHDHPHFEYLRGIEDYIKNAANLTKQLLGFARSGKYEIKPADMNEIINKSSDMFGRTKKEITIYKKNQTDIWPVEIDQPQIEQALLNLYVNSSQAMSGTGELYLQTENVTLSDNDVKPYGVEPGRYVKVSVKDTGVGMDEITQRRIFEPFFTTKEMGRGTGLGLASVYGIVKSHGGIIKVYSKKGEGATFNIFLPASTKKVVKQIKLKKDILNGTETVLLVDDEDMIIDVGRDVIKKLGYKVMTAKSGKEAIEIYKNKEAEIDMVILDMIMPEMGGGDVYDHLKDVNPDIKVLLSSGYSINGHANKILSRGCNGFIQKPFNIKDLSQEIRAVLDN